MSTDSSRPPSGRKPSGENGFQQRGTLFRATHAPNKYHCIKTESSGAKHAYISDENSICSEDIVFKRKEKTFAGKPPRIQSAKGRIERCGKFWPKDSEGQFSSYSKNSSRNGSPREPGRRPSVITLTCRVSVPGRDEWLSSQRRNYRPDQDIENRSIVRRPASAKASIGIPLDTYSQVTPGESKDIKPSVLRLKDGKHIYGSEPNIVEAWANSENEFPFKLSQNDCDAKKLCSVRKISERKIPTTLKPLESFLRDDVPQCITGIEPEKCLIFLSRNYSSHELPEVPAPQAVDDSLPYNYTAVTPRKQPPQAQLKYSHQSMERNETTQESVCKHSTFDPLTHGDISYLKNPPLHRNPHEIRLEIRELETLLEGIGSLDSNCSFVQFQAEISGAKALARRLIKKSTQLEEPEPVDTFGLLKFYKEHEEIMKVLYERRESCLQELALLEANP